MLQDPATPVEKLLPYAEHPDPYFRIALAKNPGAPTFVLTALAFDSVWQVRREAALNLSTPMSVLNMLIDRAFFHGGSHEDQITVVAAVTKRARIEHPPAPSWGYITNMRRQAKKAAE